MTQNLTHPDDVPVVPEWELCDRLRRSMRLVPGLSNQDIADFMGVARETVSTWLGGRRRPPKTTLMIWADMTGVDRDWLLTGTPSSSGLYAIRDSNPEPADYHERPSLRLLGGGAPPRPRTLHNRPAAVNRRFTPNLRVVS